ncbi:MAG: SEC-C metal-binding domain-containing protein, partial [Patescibacteria group bacterium]
LVSLEDSLMRIFAVDAIKKVMGRFNIPEDEPIENKLITNSLEKAQEKIEGFNFDARKHVLEFDDVLNFQRNIIYDKRRKILLGGGDEIKEYLSETEADLSKMPFDRSEVVEILRRVILQTIDLFWIDHLEMMEYLRGSVNLRAYGQRDPLVEYKKDGLRFFREMEASIAGQIGEFIISLDLKALLAVKQTPIEAGAREITNHQKPISHEPEVGRNDPCPCGSNKKFKKCGLLNTEEHQRLMAEKSKV